MNHLKKLIPLCNANTCIQIRSFTLSHCHTQNGSVTKITKKIGFIGDGNMAKAICSGIVDKGLITYDQVLVSSPYMQTLDAWEKCGAHVTTDNSEVAVNSDVIFLAVKPHIVSGVFNIIRESSNASKIKDKLFISILAGFTIQKLETMLSKFQGSRVIRIMPNMPMMVTEGCTMYCPGNYATADDVSLVKAMLEVSGMCERVPEHMVNAGGALSGSGPAFVFLIIEALSDGGVKMGLHREMATKFAAQTVLGAAKMVLKTGFHSGQLKDQVCSGGGSTIAGIHELERAGVRGALMNAVEIATKRSAELGMQK